VKQNNTTVTAMMVVGRMEAVIFMLGTSWYKRLVAIAHTHTHKKKDGEGRGDEERR